MRLRYLQRFQEYCTPKLNETFERYQFHMRAQKDRETFESFITHLRLLSKTCNFGGLADSLIGEQVAIGIQASNLRKRFLEESDLTLKKEIRICHTQGQVLEGKQENATVY